jgi:hypothetical protein
MILMLAFATELVLYKVHAASESIPARLFQVSRLALLYPLRIDLTSNI